MYRWGNWYKKIKGTCSSHRVGKWKHTFKLVLWDKFSHLNLEFTNSPRLGSKEAPGIPLSQPSHCCYYRPMYPYLAFYMDAGYLNSGPHACVTISFSVEEHKCIGNGSGASGMHLFAARLRNREMVAALVVLLLALVGASFVDLIHLSPTKLQGEGSLLMYPLLQTMK